jgi:hypothetical protein
MLFLLCFQHIYPQFLGITIFLGVGGAMEQGTDLRIIHAL